MVERNLAKVKVASSSLVSRSNSLRCTALFAGWLLLVQLACAAEPAPGDQTVTWGWFHITMGGKTFDRCYRDADMSPAAAANDLGDDCKTLKRVEQGENFDFTQSCQLEETPIKARIWGIARPGYIKATIQYVEVPEEMREFFEDSITMEAQRMRSCSPSEVSRVRADELSRGQK